MSKCNFTSLVFGHLKGLKHATCTLHTQIPTFNSIIYICRGGGVCFLSLMHGCTSVVPGCRSYAMSADSKQQPVADQSRVRMGEHLGGFRGAGLDLKVMSLSIRSACPPIWAACFSIILRFCSSELLEQLNAGWKQS